jgi:hypothetical protein
MIQQVLTSPVYAGVFVYGRRQRQVAPGDPPAVADRSRDGTSSCRGPTPMLFI